MRVVTASIFAIFWACVHAADIASLEKFKVDYGQLSSSTSAQDANAAIVGAALPSEAALQPFWRWYRTVDASTKGLAKQVMDEAASSQPLASSAVALAHFKTIFDKDLNDYDGGVAFAAGNAAKKWPLVTAVLGETVPASTGKLTWKAYNALDAANQALAKTEIMQSEFVEAFNKNWKAEVIAIDPNTYAERMKMRANTMNTASVGKDFDSVTALDGTKGLVSNSIYAAVPTSLRERLVRIMG